MAFHSLLLLPLAWLGRQRGRAVAAIVLIGIALPSVGAVLKPYATHAIFLLLVLAFIRADLTALRRNLARPALILAALAWTMLAVPTLAAAAVWATGLQSRAPDLAVALTLQAVASPLMSSPALAALMGLDATLALTTLILGTALVPLTAPAFTALLAIDMQLSPVALGLKLGAILGGSAAIAFLLRLFVSSGAIRVLRDEIDGLNIIILYIFVAALTSDFAAQMFASPLQVLALTALAFAISFGLLLATALVFRRAGRERAFAIGVVTSQRNMGLMLAAAGGALPSLVWLYIAVAQFPIYLAPLMLGPVVRRINGGKPL
jgi:BASS family bile acid:Na+ symporter